MPASTQAKYGRAARGQPLPLVTLKELLVKEKKNSQHNFKLEPEYHSIKC